MRKFKPITWLLIYTNIAMFIFMVLTHGFNYDFETLFNFGAMWGTYVLDNFTDEWWRLITANFIHIGIAHLISNMFALYVMGGALERFLGHIKFTLLYIITAILGATTVMMFAPDTLTAGASTAIFGILGAFATYTITDKDSLYYAVGPGFIAQIWIVVISNMYITFTDPSISIPGHIGGFFGGIILAMMLNPSRQFRQTTKLRRGTFQKPHKKKTYLPRKDKIYFFDED